MFYEKKKTRCWCDDTAVLKIGQFDMIKTCENWHGFVKSCVYYARHPREIYQVLPYSVDFKAPTE